MNQTIQFKTTKGTLTFIDVPFKITNFDSSLGDVLGYSLDNGETYSYIGIPDHEKLDTYAIAGYHDVIREHHAMAMMDEYKNGHNEIGYPFYGSGGEVDEEVNCAFMTARKSLKSLIENYTVTDCNYFDNLNIGNWLVLFKHKD